MSKKSVTKKTTLPKSHSTVSVSGNICRVALEYREGEGYFAVVNYKLGGKYLKKRKKLGTESHETAVSRIDDAAEEIAKEISSALTEDMERELAKTDPSKINFFDFLDLWYKNEKAERCWKFNTCKSNLKYLNALKKHKWLDKPLDKINADDIRKAQQARRDSGNNECTVRHEYVLLMAVFKYAIENDRLAKNPMNKIKSPKVQQKNPSVIKKEDIEGMLSDLAGRNLKLYIPVAISVLFGLRRGETVGLKWENVILESSETYPHGYLIVRSTATNDFDNGEKVTINNTTKTGKIRAIAISEKTNLIFRHIKEKEAENKKIAGNAWHAEWDGFVCRDELGDLATPDYISSAWTNYRDHYLSAKNSAYKNVRFHDLRHTAATIIYETTADMQLVQKILGHSTITTTMDIYAFFSESRSAAAMDAVADNIFKDDEDKNAKKE